MLNKEDLKYWLRSGSWRFMRDRRSSNKGRTVGTLNWNGHPVHYRPGTSDVEVIYKILLKTGRKAEYYVPTEVQPRVILDIGGNIGASSLYLAQLFPQAQVHAFEPVPDNFALLSCNLAPYSNAHAHPVALGAKEGRLQMLTSDSPLNFGGFSFYAAGSNARRTIDVEMRRPSDVLAEIGVTQVDLIKIDTEGSEYDILTAFDEGVLSKVKWITGELHGEKDFELLAFLSQWFDIGVKKTLRKRLFTFVARNKQLSSQIHL